jgi:hypothetical protein
VPLSKKGMKVLAEMRKRHGAEEGKRMFYAMENSGKHKGLKKAAQGAVVKGRRMLPREPEEEPPVSAAHGQLPYKSRLRKRSFKKAADGAVVTSRHQDLAEGFDGVYAQAQQGAHVLPPLNPTPMPPKFPPKRPSKRPLKPLDRIAPKMPPRMPPKIPPKTPLAY